MLWAYWEQPCPVLPAHYHLYTYLLHCLELLSLQLLVLVFLYVSFLLCMFSSASSKQISDHSSFCYVSGSGSNGAWAPPLLKWGEGLSPSKHTRLLTQVCNYLIHITVKELTETPFKHKENKSLTTVDFVSSVVSEKWMGTALQAQPSHSQSCAMWHCSRNWLLTVGKCPVLLISACQDLEKHKNSIQHLNMPKWLGTIIAWQLTNRVVKIFGKWSFKKKRASGQVYLKVMG